MIIAAREISGDVLQTNVSRWVVKTV